MDAAKIGDFLSALRKAQGYTQQEVAEKLNLSNKTISKWENGGGLPDITVLPALAELYGVTVDEILAGQRLGREPSGAARTRCREAELYLLRRGNLAMNICCLPAAAFAVWEVVISFYQFVSLLLYDDRGYNRSYLLLPLELLAMLIVAVGLLLQRHRFTTAYGGGGHLAGGVAAFGAEGAVSAHGGGAAGERVFVGADRAQGDHTRLHRTAGSHVGGGSLEKTRSAVRAGENFAYTGGSGAGTELRRSSRFWI